MADKRRTTPGGSGPRGRTGPGRVTSGPGRAERSTGASPVQPAPDERRRPRFTSRAAILVLVLAVLCISYASSLRAYLQQRSDIGTMKSQISERASSIDSLETEKRRWQDPAFLRQQARLRLNYVMPGEKSYVVLDKDGKQLDTESSLSDPSTVAKPPPTAWYSTAWGSVETAGHPPVQQQLTPSTEIDGSHG